MLYKRRSGIFLRHSFIVAPLLSLNGMLGMASFWGSPRVYTPTATCRSLTGDSPGCAAAIITGCGSSCSSTRRSVPFLGRPTENSRHHLTHPSLPTPAQCPQVDGAHRKATSRRVRRVEARVFSMPGPAGRSLPTIVLQPIPNI
jgi:hypothetical protein